MTSASQDILHRLEATLASRKGADPATSYVAALFAKGDDAVLKKVIEEAGEVLMAAKDGTPARVAGEAADLVFHLLVALAHFGVPWNDVIAELERREGTSGHAEKAARPR